MDFDPEETFEETIDTKEFLILRQDELSENNNIKDESPTSSEVFQSPATTGMAMKKCSQCSFKTWTNAELDRHLKSKHGFSTPSHNKQRHYTKCKICDFKSEQRKRLIAHEATCTEENVRKCQICDFKHSNAYALLRHEKVEHGIVNQATRKSFKCEICDFRTAMQKRLTEHQATCSEENIANCKQCEYKNSSVSAIRQHEKKVHGISHEMTLSECLICDFKTKWIKVMKRHRAECSTENVKKCQECDFKISSHFKLRRHEKKEHGIGPALEIKNCSLCDFKTKWPELMRKHQAKCSEEAVKKCQACDYKNSSPHSLQRHEKNSHGISHGEEFIKCSICDYKCRERYRMTAHEAKCSGNVRKCRECDFKISSSLLLMRHEKRAHGISHAVALSKKQSCLNCDFRCKTLQGMKEHRRKCSPQSVRKCQICYFKISSIALLRRHEKRRHGIDQPDLYCSICDYKCKSQQGMSTHQQTCSKDTVRRCSMCNYKISSLNALEKHEKKEHDISHVASHKCEFCDYKTKWESKLLVHAEKCSEDIIEHCLQCDFKISSNHLLRKHEKTEHGISLNSFTPGEMTKCLICDYETQWPSSMELHKAKCSEENVQKCSECPFKISSSFLLRKHERIEHDICHEFGENETFECSICDYKCKSSSQMLQHQEKCSEENVMQCNVCNFKVSSTLLMSRHVQKEHSRIEADENGIFHCKLCDFNSKWKCHIKNHNSICSASSIIQCEHCSFKISSEFAMQKHAKIEHGITIPSKKNMKRKRTNSFSDEFMTCARCDFSTVHKNSLRKHMKTSVNVETVHFCSECDFKNCIKASVVTHFRKEHGFKHTKVKSSPKTDSNPMKKKCSLCGIEDFKSFQALEDHMIGEHGLKKTEDGKLQCSHCPYKNHLSSKSFLMDHINAKHLGKKNYKCQNCDFATGWKAAFNRHSCENYNSYECSECHEKVSTRQLLNIHVAETHGLQCSKCEFRGSTVGDFSKHAEDEHNVKRDHVYKLAVRKCPHCDYQGVHRHITWHLKSVHNIEPKTSSKPKKNTTQDESLNESYVANSIEEESFECMFCKTLCKSAKMLDVHIEEHHLRVETRPTETMSALVFDFENDSVESHENLGSISTCSKCGFKADEEVLLEHFKTEHENEHSPLVRVKSEPRTKIFDLEDYHLWPKVVIKVEKLKLPTGKSIQIEDAKGEDDYQYKCHICDDTFKTVDHLERHIKTCDKDMEIREGDFLLQCQKTKGQKRANTDGPGPLSKRRKISEDTIAWPKAIVRVKRLDFTAFSLVK